MPPSLPPNSCPRHPGRKPSISERVADGSALLLALPRKPVSQNRKETNNSFSTVLIRHDRAESCGLVTIPFHQPFLPQMRQKSCYLSLVRKRGRAMKAQEVARHSTITGYRPTVSNDWMKAARTRHPFMSHLSVEHTSGADRIRSDLYLCGECRMILARRPQGVPIGHSVVHCPICGTLNEP